MGELHQGERWWKDATAAYEAAWALELDTAAGHDVWIAADLTNLGLVSHARGDLDAGQQYHTRALAIRERVAPDSLDIADSLNNLDNSYFRDSRRLRSNFASET